MKAVSIVHGARVPFAARDTSRQWTLFLRDYLRERGFFPVEVFNWSGGFYRAFGSRSQLEYANHLGELWRVARSTGFSLGILAKSQGSFIVEGALRKFTKGITVDPLIRVATADPREGNDIPHVRHVVDVFSEADRLLAKGFVLNRLALKDGASARQSQASRVVLRGLDHHAFNYDTPVEIAGRQISMYAFYCELLRTSEAD